MFILGGIILEISNHRYSSCYHLRTNVEITGQASILHGVFSLVYLFIVLFTLDVFTLFRGLDGKWDILRAGYIVFYLGRETHRSRPSYVLRVSSSFTHGHLSPGLQYTFFSLPLSFLFTFLPYILQVTQLQDVYDEPRFGCNQCDLVNVNCLCSPFVFCEQRGLAVKDAAPNVQSEAMWF